MESVCSFGLVAPHLGSFSYTPRAGNCMVFRREESLSNTSLAVTFRVAQRMGSFSYTPRDGICLVVRQEGSVCLACPLLQFVSSLYGSGVSLRSYTHRVGICLLVRRVGNLTYTPRASTSCLRLCQFLLHSAWWNLSIRSLVEAFLLGAPC